MLRCDECGGRAVAALGHVHCLLVTLCHDCTLDAVERREGAQNEALLIAAAKVEATRRHLQAQLDRSNYFGDHYHGPPLDELQAA